MGDISLSKAVRTNLLSLQNTATMMEKTQDRLATGNKVNSALDNPSNFFTASALNSRAADMGNLLDSMASGIKVIEAANNGLTALTKNLESMQSSLRQARQDKSFQNQSFEVTDNSTITLSGGQFGETKTISLADAVAKAGTKAEIATKAAGAYLGPQVDTDGKGVGARTVISNNEGELPANRLAGGDTLKIDGQSFTLEAGSNTNEAIASDLQAKLDADTATATKGKYVVTAGANGFTIEAKDPKAAAAKIEFSEAKTAQKASTSFNFDQIPSEITVGGETIQTGASFDDLVTSLTEKGKEGGFSVLADAETKKITLTSSEYGVAAPSITELPANNEGTKQVQTLAITAGANATGGTIEVGGVNITIDADATAAEVAAKIRTDLLADTDFTDLYDVADAADATDTNVVITAKAAATGVAPIEIDWDTATTGVDGTRTETTAGADPITTGSTQVAAKIGASAETVAANTDDFTVTYDGKQANIQITGITGGLGTAEPTPLDVRNWRDATISSVNAQLDKAGIKGVEGKFDADGKFSIVAKEAEAKSLSISGTDAETLFGSNTTKVGETEVSKLTATKTTDKFVELINREFGSSVRASNDNGKLRIENLSTQALDLGVDKQGNGNSEAIKVGGNDVRGNLSKQFNELRDQFDKLADDSSFNGINLLRGDKLTITFNETGSSSIAIQSKDKNDNVRAITASTLGLDSLEAIDLDNDEAIDSYIAKVSTALSELRSQASTFGSNLSSVQNRQDFTKSMINTLQTGAANLTLADMNEEAANLLALQTRQSLSSSALSMASQQDQSILQLLR